MFTPKPTPRWKLRDTLLAVAPAPHLVFFHSCCCEGIGFVMLGPWHELSEIHLLPILPPTLSMNPFSGQLRYPIGYFTTVPESTIVRQPVKCLAFDVLAQDLTTLARDLDEHDDD